MRKETSEQEEKETYFCLHLLRQPALLCSLLSLGCDLPSPVAKTWRKRDGKMIGDEKTCRVISACFSSLSSACSFFMAAIFVVFSMRSAQDFVLSAGWRWERLCVRAVSGQCNQMRRG